MRQLLVTMEGGKRQFKVTIPDDSKVTFGPWSPPTDRTRSFEGGAMRGTLRIYGSGKDNILACFSGVESFRDLSLNYIEKVAVEEGAILWKDDENGYVREQKVTGSERWVTAGEQGEL